MMGKIIKRISFGGVTLLWLFLSLIGCQGKSIPEHIRQLVFEKSKFSQPITLNLPCADDPATKEWIIQKWKHPGCPFLPPIGPMNARQIDNSILQFLSGNGFAKVEEITMGPAYNQTWKYQFLSYSDTIKPYIVNGTFEHDKCKPSVWGGGFNILLGVRTLKSIDYTNRYEATPMGIKVKFFALTFTYTLTEKFPGLPKITKQFEAKTKAYLDPNDGKWKLNELSLADNGANEFLSLLKKQ